jgi:acyl-CoA hydrolase
MAPWFFMEVKGSRELTYIERRKNLEDALRAVKRGAKVFLGMAGAEPQHLVEGLIDRAGRLHDVQVLHFITLGDAPCTEKRFDTRGWVSVPGQCAHAENLCEKRGLQRRYP